MIQEYSLKKTLKIYWSHGTGWMKNLVALSQILGTEKCNDLGQSGALPILIQVLHLQ